MTTTRGRIGSAAVGAAMMAFASFASTAHAEPAAASSDTTPVQAAPATPATSTEAAPAPTSDPLTTRQSPSSTSEAKSGRTAWPWIIMGTGVAFIAGAAVLEVLAIREDDKRESAEIQLFALPPGDPNKATLAESAQSHDDAAKRNQTTALIVGTIGFLTVAGSVVLWFVEGSSSVAPSTPAAKAKLRPTLLPSFGPSYAGASLGASF